MNRMSKALVRTRPFAVAYQRQRRLRRAARWSSAVTLARSLSGLSLIGALALGGIDACAPTTVSLAGGPREYVAADYETVLRKWTRTGNLIALSELDDLLTVTATFESYDFRWAYVVRYAQDYRLTVEQRRQLLEGTLDETRHRHQFYVALYGSNPRWTDLGRPTTAWIVRLIDDQGSETAPEEIVSIRKPGAIERTYFPYTSVWRQAFRIRFPIASAQGRATISPQAKWFGLRFAGSQGNEELRWELTAGSTTPTEGSPNP